MSYTPGPFQPQIPIQGPRHLYKSVAQVTRLTPSLTASGDMSLSWSPVSDIVDVWQAVPAMLQCRVELGFVRRGVDLKAPLVAGRAPDRIGVCYFDPVTDVSGGLLVKANDRLVMQSGPIYGTFEIRVIPDVAQDLLGAHHVEVQVIEVSQALQAGSVTPFPGSAP